MASKRMISRRVALSKKLALISYQTETLYHRGLPFLDDAGRMTADPDDYRALIIPKGKRGRAVPLSQIESVIEELYEVGLIGICGCPEKRCMEYTDFEKYNIIKKDRTPQIECKEPIGFNWKTLEDTVALCLREEKLIEGKGEEPPPAFQQLIHKAREIRGWDYSKETEVAFFNSLREFPIGIILKTIPELATHQISAEKPYKNPMMALRNWCKKAKEWQEEREGDVEPTKTDSGGNPLISVGDEWITGKEFDELRGAGEVVWKDDKWIRVKGES